MAGELDDVMLSSCVAALVESCPPPKVAALKFEAVPVVSAPICDAVEDPTPASAAVYVDTAPAATVPGGVLKFVAADDPAESGLVSGVATPELGTVIGYLILQMPAYL